MHKLYIPINLMYIYSYKYILNINIHKIFIILTLYIKVIYSFEFCTSFPIKLDIRSELGDGFSRMLGLPTHRKILLNKTEIRLYLPFSDRF